MPNTNQTAQLPAGPLLILVRGLPGSGKSYLAKALQQAIGEDKVALVDPDATDYQNPTYVTLSKHLTEEGVDAKFHPYRFLRAQAHAGIEAGKYIIWNQAFTNLDGLNKTVINLRTHAGEHGAKLRVLIVEVEASQATVRQRVAERASAGGHDVPPEEFARFFNDYKSFAGEGYDVVSVSGENDVNVSVATVLTALESLV